MSGKSINETKVDRFKRVASRRTQNVLDAMRKLGNCSNKGIYNYTDEEVMKIFHAIEQELKRVKILFTTKSKNNTFSL
ncbi:MAG: hypothetical protein A2987_01290 [Omnitrophica bacterium RIFCSPLOWO2_01_FULL_45_10]|nr:MAG: hypothetical protein A2987_01290 [Omnitrophica bacterium RIFCSPLOWO2_01_FULL_45_10]